MPSSLPPRSRKVGATKTLDIYVIDVEGGNAQLYVTPSGESILIDAGNGGAAAARDADRIMAAVKAAGLTQIDRVITTHYHGDHIGGLPELRDAHSDSGVHRPRTERPAGRRRSMRSCSSMRRSTPRRGTALSNLATGSTSRIWTGASSTAGGKVISTPLPGAGAAESVLRRLQAARRESRLGPACRQHRGRAVGREPGDVRKVPVAVSGRLHLEPGIRAQLSRSTASATVDLFVASRHGQPSSNSEALVHAIRPRVTIMNNGTRKGGQPDAMKILLNSPGLAGLWQMHFSLLGGQEYTVPGMFIANVYDEQQPADARGADDAAAAGRASPAAAPAQRACVLDQGVGADGWHVHRHERPERLQQDVPGGGRDELNVTIECPARYLRAL